MRETRSGVGGQNQNSVVLRGLGWLWSPFPVALLAGAVLCLVSPGFIPFYVAGAAVGVGVSVGRWLWLRFGAHRPAALNRRVAALAAAAIFLGLVVWVLLAPEAARQLHEPSKGQIVEFPVDWQETAVWGRNADELSLRQTLTVSESDVAQAAAYVVGNFGPRAPVARVPLRPKAGNRRALARYRRLVARSRRLEARFRGFDGNAMGRALTRGLRRLGWRLQQQTNLSLRYSKPTTTLRLKDHALFPAEETNMIPPPDLSGGSDAGPSAEIVRASDTDLRVAGTLVPFILTPKSSSALTVDGIPSGAVGNVFPPATARGSHDGRDYVGVPLLDSRNFELDVRSPPFRLWALQRFIELSKQTPFELFLFALLVVSPKASRGLLKRLWERIKGDSPQPGPSVAEQTPRPQPPAAAVEGDGQAGA